MHESESSLMSVEVLMIARGKRWPVWFVAAVLHAAVVLLPAHAQYTLNAHPGPPNNGGSSGLAVLFDLVSTSTDLIVLKELVTASQADADGQYSIEIHSIAGTALGGPVGSGPGSSTNGWTFHGSVQATQGSETGGISLPIPLPAITVPPGDTLGIALIFVDAGPRYIGTGTPPLATYTNAHMKLITGDARSALFTTGGAFFSSRELVGSVTYELIEAPSLIVTTASDVVDPLDGQTSLREAIAYAATLTGPQTITFSDTTAGGAVNFHSGSTNTITLSVTNLTINSDLTIVGPGANVLSINGNNAVQNFLVASNRTAEISGLTIRGGRSDDAGGGIQNHGALTVRNCTLTGNYAVHSGGGIHNHSEGTLTVLNSSISGNNATGQAGGIRNLGTLTMQNSTVHGNTTGTYGGIRNEGAMTVFDSTISGNHASGLGGGIRNDGTLTVQNSAIINNSVSGGGAGIRNHGTLTVQDSTVHGNNGGGLRNEGTLTVLNSTISSNAMGSASVGGIHNLSTLTLKDSVIHGNSGGLRNEGAMTVSDSTISGNTAHFDGGGIYNLAGSTGTVRNCTFIGNSADRGGGIRNNGTLTVDNCTFSGNRALYNDGGGFYNGGSLAVHNSTISSNTTSQSGGGFFNDGTLTLLHSTISGNAATGFYGGDGIFNRGPGTLNIGHTILHGGSGSRTNYVVSGTPVLNSLGYNISSDGTGPASGTDQIDTDPLLGPLADNGGPTMTHELLIGSPAIDAGNPGFDPNAFTPPMTNDQRGELRVVRGHATSVTARIDIGAYERFAVPTVSADNYIVVLGEPPVDLETITAADPTGGTFAGTNVNSGSGTFDSDGLNAGDIVSVTYSITDNYGATNLITFTIRIMEAPSLIVTTTNDVVDAFDGQTSLREAIAYADTLTNAVGITFSDATANGAVNFHDGASHTITLGGTQLEINSDVTIEGPGADVLTISGNNTSRVFRIWHGSTTEISRLTISGGRPSSGGGGGILSDGALTVKNSTIAGNAAGGSGGGGIAAWGPLAVLNSTIISNTTTGGGGGIMTDNNHERTVQNSTISGNAAHSGGGIRNGGPLTLFNSTVSSNTATADGGGIFNHLLGTLTVHNSTISGNTALSSGGGVLGHGDLTVLNSTIGGGIYMWTPGTLYIGHTILYSGVGDAPNFGSSGTPLINSLGYNLSSDGTGPDAPTDLLNTDPLLGPLADNGGPTLTHALVFGSPAMNAGVPVVGITNDQRGVSRPQGPAPDIGAYEREFVSIITNVAPAQANVGGGIDVVIQGVELGIGTDITNVTLAGVAATILSQNVNEVTVRANAAPALMTGDVMTVSTMFGELVRSNAFEYLWLAPPEQLDPVDITSTALTARWWPNPDADTHHLEVGLDTNFTAHLPGYEWLDVMMAHQYPVTGLTAGEWYALRLFAENEHGLSWPSRTVWVPAGENTPYELNPPPSAPVTQGADMGRQLAYMFHGTGLVYTAESSDTNVVTAAIENGMLLIDPVGPGQAVITLTATDPNTGYAATYEFTIEVIGPPALLSGDFLPREPWNPRFTQVLEVYNDSNLDAMGVRVLFDNLMPGITVENQTGVHSDGRPMIEWETPFAAGTIQRVSIVYVATGAHRPDQYPPTIELQYILPEWEPPAPGMGMTVEVRAILPDGRIVLEFTSVPGLLYAMEYMDDFPNGTWREAPVRLRAGANRTQWIDPGPPTTPPWQGMRVYRVRWVDEGNTP
jgi:parallel beta-helix repeat protein